MIKPTTENGNHAYIIEFKVGHIKVKSELSFFGSIEDEKYWIAKMEELRRELALREIEKN